MGIIMLNDEMNNPDTVNKSPLQVLKEKLGLQTANCENCVHFEHEVESEYGHVYAERYLCNNEEKKNHETVSNLKSFPFKKEQAKCWYPDIHKTKVSLSFTFDWNENDAKICDDFNDLMEQYEKEVLRGN